MYVPWFHLGHKFSRSKGHSRYTSYIFCPLKGQLKKTLIPWSCKIFFSSVSGISRTNFWLLFCCCSVDTKVILQQNWITKLNESPTRDFFHSIQSWIATERHGLTRTRRRKQWKGYSWWALGYQPLPPSKTPLPLFPKPPLNQQTAKPPFLGNPPYILVFCDSPKSPVKPPLFQNLVEDSPPAPPHPPPYSRYPLWILESCLERAP